MPPGMNRPGRTGSPDSRAGSQPTPAELCVLADRSGSGQERFTCTSESGCSRQKRLTEYDEFIAECAARRELIQRTPLAELKWRAAIASDTNRHYMSGPDGAPNEIAEGVEVFGCQPDSGDGWTWYFTRDGKSLPAAFCHESDCNAYELHDEGDEN